MTRSQAQYEDDGFTLIELLVVLVLLTFLGALVSAGLRTAALGWRHVERANASREVRRNTQDALESLLSHISPAKYLSSSKTVVDFSGNASEMSFIAPLPQRYGARDPVRYSMRMIDGEGLRLTWRFDRRDDQSGDYANSSTEEAIVDARHGSFAYFGQIDGSTQPTWSSVWQSQPSLPRLIRLRVDIAGSDIDLVVAPRVSGASCSMRASVVECANLN